MSGHVSLFTAVDALMKLLGGWYDDVDYGYSHGLWCGRDE